MNLLVSTVLCKTQNPFFLKIIEIYKSLVVIGKHIIFTSIPSSMGIHGNQQTRKRIWTDHDFIFDCTILHTHIMSSRCQIIKASIEYDTNAVVQPCSCHGNAVVDQEAGDALNNPIFNCSIPYANCKPFIIQYILKRWQDSWDQQIHSKLQRNTFLSRQRRSCSCQCKPTWRRVRLLLPMADLGCAEISIQ
jgi:hypothetical protein